MKLWNYTFLILGISVLMTLGGFPVAGLSQLFNILGITVGSTISATQSQSTLWNYVFGTSGILVLGIGSTAIGIGTFIYTKDKSFLMMPVVTNILFYWLSCLVSILNTAGNYGIFGTIIAVILIPFTAGYILTAIEWFLGIDN